MQDEDAKNTNPEQINPPSEESLPSPDVNIEQTPQPGQSNESQQFEPEVASAEQQPSEQPVEQAVDHPIEQAAEQPVVEASDIAPETASAAQVEQSATPVQSPAVPAASPGGGGKKSRKGLIGVLVAVGAVLVLGGGSAAAYSVWYQNPDKVVTDGIVNLMTNTKPLSANAELTISNSDVDVKITLDGSGDGKNGQVTASVAIDAKGDVKMDTIKVDVAAVMTESGDYYVKVDHLKNAVDSVIDTIIDEQLSSMRDYYSDSEVKEMHKEYKRFIDDAIGDIVKKVDGQWIRISSEYLAKNSDDSDQADLRECYQDALDMVREGSARDELIGVYKDNQFIEVVRQLGSADGNLGYELNVDTDQAKKFGEAAKNTEFGKAIEKCGDSDAIESEFDDLDADESEVTDQKIEIWVSRWSHQIAKISASGSSGDDADKTNFQAVINIDYGAALDVKTPEGATDIDKLFEGADSSGLLNGFIDV